jgi:hypothetical protein
MSVPEARRPAVPDLSRQLPSPSGLPARARFTGVPVPAGSPRAAADLQEAPNKLAPLLAETLERVTPASQELTTFENHPFATYDAENVLSLVQELESFEKARQGIDLPAQPGEAPVQDLRRKLVLILETRLLTLDGDHISLKQFHQLRVAMRTLGVSQQLMHDFETLESQVVRKRLGLNRELPYATRRFEQAPMNAIGSGKCNTVYSTEAVLENGSRFPGIYKADRKGGFPDLGIDDASPNWGIRNLATSRVDRSLKFGVVVETHLVLNEVRPGEWETGCIMEQADGFSPVYLGQVTMDVGAPVASALLKNPRLLSAVVTKRGFSSGHIDGTRLTLHCEGPKKDENGRLKRYEFAVPPNLENSEFRKNMSRLQLLDHMLIQVDRAPCNYFVKDGLVQGIDNDMSFCPLWPETLTYRAPIIPRVIDREAAEALRDYTPEKLAEDCMGLDPGDIRAVQERLLIAQAAIKKYRPGPPLEFEREDEPEGWIMEPGADWSTPEVSRALGIESFPRQGFSALRESGSFDPEDLNEQRTRHVSEAAPNHLARLMAFLAYCREHEPRVPVVTRDELVAIFESRIRKDLL